MRVGRPAAALLVLPLLVACAAARPGAAASAVPHAGSTARIVQPTSAPSQLPLALATGSPVAGLPPAAPGTCRIPIADISEARGWFIVYPGGQRLDDPSSVVALPGGTPGKVGQNPGLTFARKPDHWVPVPFEWVSPNGLMYAYQDVFQSSVKAMAIATGVSTELTTAGGFSIVDSEDDGVYATQVNDGGAFFVPFDTSQQPRQVAQRSFWTKYSGGALWGVSGGRLIRHDLASGAEAAWGPPVGDFGLLGFDYSGNPIVETTPAGLPAGSIQLTVLRADGTLSNLWTASGLSVGRAIGDATGIWWEAGGGIIGAPGHGLYHWSVAAGAQLVSTPEANLAGRCS